MRQTNDARNRCTQKREGYTPGNLGHQVDTLPKDHLPPDQKHSLLENKIYENGYIAKKTLPYIDEN
jgi:hypothetical protein